MIPTTYKHHDPALKVRFSSLQDEAFAQNEVLLHSPGMLIEVTKGSQQYLYWRYYVAGKLRDEYIGPAADSGAQARATEVRAAIKDAQSLADASRLLRRSGFQGAANTTALTIAALFNAG